MWTSNPPVRLLRYLFVLRVNSTLIRLPRYPALEFSLVLGGLLAEHLPTREARAWRRALTPWYGFDGPILTLPITDAAAEKRAASQRKTKEIPDIQWPINAVIHLFPDKLVYGQGERIVWEFKLYGQDADHNLFLETILPTVERAGGTRDQHWNRPYKLWGHFDIDAVYVARGLKWEPLAQAGKLDLRTQPTDTQWAEELSFVPPEGMERLTKLSWLSPFAFDTSDSVASSNHNPKQKKRLFEPPTLATILNAVRQRIDQLGGIQQIGVDAEGAAKETSHWETVMTHAQEVKLRRRELEPTQKDWPGQGIGWQSFDHMPPTALPYLALGSILHIGRYAHFGCGTYTFV
ncbi:hypothetical protein KFU94_18075 [Chloroflexi bacterium TSY]|nr:hypothetical protein [Chloroflexi bacterium TSY]